MPLGRQERLESLGTKRPERGYTAQQARGPLAGLLTAGMRRFQRLARWGGGTHQPWGQRMLQHPGLVQVAGDFQQCSGDFLLRDRRGGMAYSRLLGHRQQSLLRWIMTRTITLTPAMKGSNRRSISRPIPPLFASMIDLSTDL